MNFSKPEVFQPVLLQAKFVEELMFKYSEKVTKFEAFAILLLKSLGYVKNKMEITIINHILWLSQNYQLYALHVYKRHGNYK